MSPTVAKAGQIESVERRYHGWSGKLGVVVLLGGLALAFSPAFLEVLVRSALIRYLAVAHFGRGRGAYA